ncbi:hypothetical protein D3C84_1005780 [compost metagenome]
MYSSAWKPRNAQPSNTVIASQIFNAPRWPFLKAWWAMVIVTLELTSNTVLSNGRPQGLMTSFGGTKSLESGLFSSGQVHWKAGHSMWARPLVPSPPKAGPDTWRT